MIRRLAAAAVLSLALTSGPVYGGEYREGGWPVPDMDRYSNQGYYSECRDGDGEKETIAEIFKDLNRNFIFKYKTRLRSDGTGGKVWAIEDNDGTIVDSLCTGIFDTRYRIGDRVPMPECVKSLNSLEKYGIK